MKAAGVFAAAFAMLSHAQSRPPAATPKFDVVSVKPCKSGGARSADSSPGRLSIGCALLADTDNTGLLQQAYNRYASGQFTSGGIIPIEGGPDWVRSEGFAFDAKADGQPSILMMLGPMMQALLEDRFRLKIHRETRQGPVYELVVAKGAPKLNPLQEGKCVPVLVGHPLPALAADQHYCRNLVGPGVVDFEGGTLSILAGMMGLLVDRPVIDKTGITDYFKIQLKFSPEDSPTPRQAAAGEVRQPDAPGIFEAIQEQLGLRLVPAKGPVDVLVIDYIERPSEN